jgi:hypothetical protein
MRTCSASCGDNNQEDQLDQERRWIPTRYKISTICAIPLGLVFNERQVAVQDKPDDFFARDELCYLLFAVMDIFVTISKLVSECFGAAFNFS